MRHKCHSRYCRLAWSSLPTALAFVCTDRCRWLVGVTLKTLYHPCPKHGSHEYWWVLQPSMAWYAHILSCYAPQWISWPSPGKPSDFPIQSTPCPSSLDYLLMEYLSPWKPSEIILNMSNKSSMARILICPQFPDSIWYAYVPFPDHAAIRVAIIVAWWSWPVCSYIEVVDTPPNIFLIKKK